MRSEWIIAKTEAVAPHAMISADQPLAAEAGAAVLREGGNAVDAAVTAAFAMGVTEPFTSGLGGVATLVVRHPDGRTAVIDGSGLAPRAAREDMFGLASGDARAGMYGWPATEGNAQHVGPRSVGVPGTVACFALALERHGTISLRRAIEPSIALAADGFDVDYYLAVALASFAERLLPHAESARTFFRPGGLPLRTAVGLEAADRLLQPDLARSLERLASEGPEIIYRGEIARAMVADVRAQGGVLSIEDLTAYRARELAPLRTTYRDVEIATIPECGGGVTLVEALNVLEGYPLAALERSGADELHLIAEASRLAFADRLALLADPAQVDAPFARLASKEHAELLRASIDAHGVGGRNAVAVGAAQPDIAHTTHVCAIDGERRVVSLTSTLGGGFGSGVVAKGTGILLGNVMTWFDPRPGRPNSIAPGKRILWAPAPTVVTRDGRPLLALGAPGGRKLITAVLQSLVNILDHGDGPQDAVNRPRVHCEGADTWIDSRVPEAVRSELARRGHRLIVKEETLSSTWFGRPNAIAIDGPSLRGGVNRLKPSMAVGF